MFCRRHSQKASEGSSRRRTPKFRKYKTKETKQVHQSDKEFEACQDCLQNTSTVQPVPWLARVVQSVSGSWPVFRACISDLSTTSFRFLARSAFPLSCQVIPGQFNMSDVHRVPWVLYRNVKNVKSRLLICNHSHRPFCCLDLCRRPVHASPSASIPKALQNVNTFFIKA